MSSSQIEKLEQLIAAEPRSPAFADLASALLDRGDAARALAVCEAGLAHSPQLAAGRVAFGRSLLALGRAAEAMKQFDLAMSVEKDDPGPYVRVAEILLRKALYRSAIPILRRAAALETDNTRTLRWLSEAKAALSGGPPPTLDGDTTIDAADPSASPPARRGVPAGAASGADATPPSPGGRPAGALPPPAPSPGFSSSAASRGASSASTGDTTSPELPLVRPTLADGGDAPTEAPLRAVVSDPNRETRPLGPSPAQLGIGVALREHPDSEPLAPEAPTRLADGGPAETIDSLDPVGGRGPVRRPEPPSEPRLRVVPASPGGAVVPSAPRGSEAEATLPASSLPRAPTAGRPERAAPPVPEATLEIDQPGTLDDAPDPLLGYGAAVSAFKHQEMVTGLTTTFAQLEAQGTAPMSAGPPAPGPGAVPGAGARGAGGLLDDVASVQVELPTGELALPSALRDALHEEQRAPATESVTPASLGLRALLADIPDEPVADAPPVVVAPPPEAAPQFAQAVVKEYEQELRRKLEARALHKTFVQEHWRLLTGLALVVVVVGALGGAFIHKRLKHGGENLQSALGKGLAAIAADTKEQYQSALQLFGLALEMDQGSVEAKAWKAYAHAVLFAEHGGAQADRDAARALVAEPLVRAARRDLGVLVDALTAQGQQAAVARVALQAEAAVEGSALIEAQLGKLLLAERRPDEALKHLQRAVQLDPRSVRALVDLGEYYLAFDDYEQASTVLTGTVAAISRLHPRRLVLLAEARLELGGDLKEALDDLELLGRAGGVPTSLEGRYALVLGRALGARGRYDEAKATLTNALVAHPGLAYELRLALGAVHRDSGRMALAQKEYEEAVRLAPRSERAKEALGRILLARGRERELLETVKAEKGARRLALVRGIAWARLGDSKRSRQELQAAGLQGKFPAEAVVYLALADAAEEAQPDKAIAKLEQLAAATKRDRATVHVALAKLHLQRSALDKARKQLEEAAADPLDYEGTTMLGELLLKTGGTPEQALEHFQRAAERNGSYAPARRQLVRLLLAAGKGAEAAREADAWVDDSPESPAAWLSAAAAYLQSGRIKEAAAAVQRGIGNDSTDLDGWRLRARVLFASGDPRAALQALERANSLNPKDPETFCEIGNGFVRQGNPDTSLRAYEAAVREAPKSHCGRLGPIHAYPVGGRSRERRIALLDELEREAASSWDRVSTQATRARLLLDAKSVQDAIALAEAAVAAEPHHPWAWFALGEAARRAKNDPRAIEAYRRTVELDGAWTAARLQLADAYVRTGPSSYAKALIEYERVVALTESDAEQSRAESAAKALRRQVQ